MAKIIPGIKIGNEPTATIGWWNVVMGIFMFGFLLYIVGSGSFAKYVALLFTSGDTIATPATMNANTGGVLQNTSDPSTKPQL